MTEDGLKEILDRATAGFTRWPSDQTRHSALFSRWASNFRMYITEYYHSLGNPNDVHQTRVIRACVIAASEVWNPISLSTPPILDDGKTQTPCWNIVILDSVVSELFAIADPRDKSLYPNIDAYTQNLNRIKPIIEETYASHRERNFSTNMQVLEKDTTGKRDWIVQKFREEHKTFVENGHWITRKIYPSNDMFRFADLYSAMLLNAVIPPSL